MAIGPAKKTPDSNLRSEARRKSLKSGRVHFNLGRSSLDVVVTDLSATGARFRMSIPMPCPARFDLEILHAATGTAATRRCSLRWQRGTNCGVEFI